MTTPLTTAQGHARPLAAASLIGLLLLLAGCSFESSTLGPLRCQQEGARDGARICQGGFWTLADGGTIVPVDMADMTPADMADMAPADMADMAPADMADMAPDMCIPQADVTLCQQQQAQCGTIEVTDRCGVTRQVDCAAQPGLGCGAEGQCDEATRTCLQCSTPTCPQGATCGEVSNACGDTVSCGGDCGTDEVCDTTSLQCVCPDPVCPAGAVCGEVSNACGSTTSCGTCGTDEVCDTAARLCECTDPVCPAEAMCGMVSNACGNTAQCGAGCQYGASCLTSLRCGDVELRPSRSRPRDFFGAAVAISGTNIVVGAPGDDDGGADAGAVFVFSASAPTNTWMEAQKLLPAGATAANDAFGAAVDINADRLIVGAPQGATSGNAYIFERSGSTWQRRATLSIGTLTAGAGFGTAVAIAGDLAVVGAPGSDTAAADAGEVFLFERDPISGAWTQRTGLQGHDTAAGHRFGWSVALDGGRLAVGAPRVGASGALYLFAPDAVSGIWGQQPATSAFTPPVGGVNEQLGGDVALLGDHLFGGAATADLATVADAGVGYLFDLTASSQRQLKASDAAADDGLGAAVAIDGTRLVMAAPLEDDQADDAGALYVYALDSTGQWTQEYKLTATGGSSDDMLGRGWLSFQAANSSLVLPTGSLDLEGKLVVAGSPQLEASGKGVVHIFQLP